MVFIGNQPTAVPLTSSQLTDGIITTAKIADGAVVNVDVNSTAAIAYSKLNLATSIVNADINSSAAIALSKLATTGTMTFASTIGVGGATPAASGAGITFPASASASSDANTLDDYEEGTWTPTVGGTSAYNVQVGRYVKVGRIVSCQGAMTLSSLGTGSTTQISGLPFTVVNTGSNGAASCTFGYWANSAVNTIALFGVVGNNDTTIQMSGKASSGDTIDYQIGFFGNSTRVDFNLTYVST